MTDAPDLASLRAIAEAASGAWGEDDASYASAAFRTSFNPAAVLALLDRVARAEAALAEASPASEPNPIPDAGAVEPVASRWRAKHKHDALDWTYAGAPPAFERGHTDFYAVEPLVRQSDHIQALQAAEADRARLTALLSRAGEIINDLRAHDEPADCPNWHDHCRCERGGISRAARQLSNDIAEEIGK